MTFSPYSRMTDTRSILWRGLLNVLVVILIAIPVFFLYVHGKPTIRGFFCNDESIRHPFLSSTVPAPPMYIVGFVLPAVVVAVVEFSGRRTLPQEGNIVWGRITIPSYAVTVFFLYVGYLFGMAVTQCLTDVTKYWVGRLRPHFIAVCNPDFSLIKCGTDTSPIYVTDYVCRGNGEVFGGDAAEIDHRIREARISFVSGHSSFSFQIAIFLILYLQARGLPVFNRNNTHFLVIPLLQFAFLTSALLVAISRVMDYKHHAGDVIGGGLLGTLVQFLNVVSVMKLFKKAATQQLPESLDDSLDVRNTSELVEDGRRASDRYVEAPSLSNYYFANERPNSGTPHTPHN